MVSGGYNGAPKYTKHCRDIGCLTNAEGRCIRTIHAEMNAIMNLAFQYRNSDDLILWCTHHPCMDCVKLCISCGIRKVNYFIDYVNQDLLKYLGQISIETIEINKVSIYEAPQGG